MEAFMSLNYNECLNLSSILNTVTFVGSATVHVYCRIHELLGSHLRNTKAQSSSGYVIILEHLQDSLRRRLLFKPPRKQPAAGQARRGSMGAADGGGIAYPLARC